MDNVLATTPAADRIAQSIKDNATSLTIDADLKAFEEYEKSVLPMVVRIEFQILATQYCEHVKASSHAEKAQWMKLMLQTLTKMEHNLSQLQQSPSNIFLDLAATAEVYFVLGAGPKHWCEVLFQQLTQVFLNAPAVDGRKEIACISKWLKEEPKIEKREDVSIANQASVIGIFPASSD